MVRSRGRCAGTPDLFGAVSPAPPAAPPAVTPTPLAWQVLEARRLQGLLPPAEGLAHPWWLQAEAMRPGLEAHLGNLNAWRRRNGLAPFPTGGWLHRPSPAKLPHPATGLWLLAWVVKLADDLVRYTTLVQQRCPLENPSMQAAMAECRQSVKHVRRGLKALLRRLSYREAASWEWVHALAYWQPQRVQAMARKDDWQQLAAKHPHVWGQHPGSRPIDDATQGVRAPQTRGLPPPYPLWVFGLHLELLGPLIMRLAPIPANAIPASPLQRTFHQVQQPKRRPAKARRRPGQPRLL